MADNTYEYAFFIAVDHTRVILKTGESTTPGDDYINANTITVSFIFYTTRKSQINTNLLQNIRNTFWWIL